MLTQLTVLSFFLPCVFPLRCYTDIPATKVWKWWEIVMWPNLLNLQSLSVECGMNTGCLKIFKKAEQFDEYGTFIPPHRRGEDTQLFRGIYLTIIWTGSEVYKRHKLISQTSPDLTNVECWRSSRSHSVCLSVCVPSVRLWYCWILSSIFIILLEIPPINEWDFLKSH